jgi:hypothetical protein
MTHLQFIDTEKKRIEYRDMRFYSANDAPNLFVPSVSTILNCAPKGAGFYEFLKNRGKDADAVAMEAMERGSRIHKASEDYDINGELIIQADKYTIEEVEMIHRYVEFSNRYIKKTPIAIEQGAASIKLGYGGTLDRVIEWNGKYYLLDIKTGGIYDYYWRQQAAYKELWELFNPDKPITNYGIIHLKALTRKDDEWQGHGWKVIWNEKPHQYWWNLFQNTKQEYHILYPNASPNNRIFDLHIVKPKYESEAELFKIESEVQIEKPKRGRKSKKDLLNPKEQN